MSTTSSPPRGRPSFEEAVAALAMLLMLTLVCGEILARQAFNASFMWAEEVARYLMIWSVYFGAAAAVASRQHLRIEMMVDVLPHAARRVLAVVAQLWVLAFSLAITYAGYLWVRDSFQFGMVSADSNLAVQLGWIQLVIPVTFALSAIHSVRILIALIRPRSADARKD